MQTEPNFKVAVLWHQRHSSGSSTDLSQGRFVPLYNAIQSLEMSVHPLVYSDETLDRPDVIDTLGSKGVLFATREMSWGSHVDRYNNYDELCKKFPEHLLSSGTRVLKKHSDSSGSGVWKVESHTSSSIRVRQAARGGEDVITTLSDFLPSIKHYFDDSGYVVDQVYQNRLEEGMTRCYMVLL